MLKLKNNEKKFLIFSSIICITCIISTILLINHKKKSNIEKEKINKNTNINYKIDSKEKTNELIKEKNENEKKMKKVKEIKGSKIILQNNKSLDLSTMKSMSENEKIVPNDTIIVREIHGEKYYFVYNKPYSKKVNFKNKTGKVLTCMISNITSSCLINDNNESFLIDKNVYITDSTTNDIKPFFQCYQYMRKGDIVKLFILDNKVVNILKI